MLLVQVQSIIIIFLFFEQSEGKKGDHKEAMYLYFFFTKGCPLKWYKAILCHHKKVRSLCNLIPFWLLKVFFVTLANHMKCTLWGLLVQRQRLILLISSSLLFFNILMKLDYKADVSTTWVEVIFLALAQVIEMSVRFHLSVSITPGFKAFSILWFEIIFIDLFINSGVYTWRSVTWRSQAKSYAKCRLWCCHETEM